MQTCPSRDEWIRHLDGEATANRATELGAHAAGCAACRREIAQFGELVDALRAPVAATGPATVARVMARLDEHSPAPARSRRGARRRWPWLTAAIGLAAAAVVALVTARSTSSPDEFSPRGRSAPGEARTDRATALGERVGVVVHALGSELEPLADGARVAPSTAYVASYRNPGATRAFAMVFAIDAAREVHWLYPGYTDPATDPPAVALSTATTAALFDETVVLDHPAPGAMALVVLVTSRPLRVSDIERLPRSARTVAGVRARWPTADLRAVTVEVR